MNVASSYGATIGGGGYINSPNSATADYATIGGGVGNTASGYISTIGGGYVNTVSGSYATAPGGLLNTAAGYSSFAAGRRAKANSQGCFVWGDSTDADVTCGDDNRTIFRSSGGYYIYTNSGLTSGMYLVAGGSAWNAVSNRALKENLAAVDSRLLLARLAQIDISTWNYKSQDAAIRHIGPMADDFNALVEGLGGEGQDRINSLDADGVALAAIQGLYQIVQDKDTRITALEKENANLETRLEALEARVNGGSPATSGLGGLGVFGLALAGLAAGWVVSRRR